MAGNNVDLVRSVVSPWASGDFSGWISLFADDVVMTAYMPEGVTPIEGREAVLEYLVEYASQWSEYRVVAEDVASVGEDAVLVTGRQVGIGRGSGVRVDETVFVDNALRGGKIVGSHWHVDRGKALEAAGFSAQM